MIFRNSHYLLFVASSAVLSNSNLYAETQQLDTVVVIGEAENIESDLAGSVDVLSRDELNYEHVDDTLELFNKVPGVYIARYNQGVINTDIAIRGFAGDGVSPHAKLLIDGVPANLHNGYNELDQLFPIGIDSINVFKGTSDARYGLYNIAGNYNVSTRQDVARELELTLGSFNTMEAQGYFGLSNGNFKQNYMLGYRTSEGYREHTDLTKYALAGSWQWDLAANKEVRVIARTASYEGDAPGYLTKDEAKDDPKQSANYSHLDGGEKQTNHLSVHWSQPVGEAMMWNLKAYTQTFERERWVRFSEGGTLRNRYDDQSQLGFISTLIWDFSDQMYLDWGLDYEAQDVIEQRFNTVSTDSRTPDKNSVRRNHEYDFTAMGTYLKFSHDPSEALHWNVALRADQLDGNFTNRADGEKRDMYDFGTILQPKFNIVYSASDSVNLFTNVGRSYQHPFGAAAYTAGDTGARDVSINDGWELGTQWSPAKTLTLRVSYWQQNASDEYVVIDGTPENVGKTERSGIDLAFNGDLNESWSYWGNYTTIDSEIVKSSDAEAANEGNELLSIPSFTASLGVNYHATPKLVTRIHIDAQGDYYVNNANVGGKFGDYTLLNASADYDAGWGVIKAQLNNLTDEYYEYVYDFSADGSATIHSPGDGINGSVSVNFSL